MMKYINKLFLVSLVLLSNISIGETIDDDDDHDHGLITSDKYKSIESLWLKENDYSSKEINNPKYFKETSINDSIDLISIKTPNYLAEGKVNKFRGYRVGIWKISDFTTKENIKFQFQPSVYGDYSTINQVLYKKGEGKDINYDKSRFFETKIVKEDNQRYLVINYYSPYRKIFNTEEFYNIGYQIKNKKYKVLFSEILENYTRINDYTIEFKIKLKSKYNNKYFSAIITDRVKDIEPFGGVNYQKLIINQKIEL